MLNTQTLRQSFFATLLTLLVFSSCTKPVDDVPEERLQLTEFSDGSDVTRFEYNTDRSLKKIILSNDPVSLDDNVTYTVKHLNQGKIDELTGSNGTKIKLSYTNGFLSKAEAFDGTIKISQTDYAYNGNVLRSSTISMIENNTAVPFFKGEFTFTSTGNISRTNAFMYNPLTNRLEATGYVNKQYDTKINPFATLGDVVKVFWQVAPVNNVTKAEYFNATGQPEEVVQTTYTYNAKGYPVSATMRETEAGQPPVTATLTYKYQ